MDTPTVLVLTQSRDFYTVDLVTEALIRRGLTVHRFDSDLFPSKISLSVRLGDGNGRYELSDPTGELRLENVRSVWFRSVPDPLPQDDVDPTYREACGRESRAAIWAFCDGLDEAYWLNHPIRAFRARNKLFQLRLAREAGLRIPRTLLTNDAAEARSFFHDVGQRMVTKMLTPFATGTEATGTEGDVPFVYTSVVTRDDLAAAEELRVSPMLFQEQVPKEREIRVVAVRGRFFVASLERAPHDGAAASKNVSAGSSRGAESGSGSSRGADLSSRSASGAEAGSGSPAGAESSSGSPTGAQGSRHQHQTDDWRTLEPAAWRWRRDTLPEDCARALRALLGHLGLDFGAIDLIRTPEGEHVFLEVNPGGEWGMIQRDLGEPVAEAIAEALAEALSNP